MSSDPSISSILIVDDSPTNLRLLSHVLSEQGYKVRVATNGTRALESVHANPPDLILLDVMMPDIDGYAVCEQLKADEQTRDIPVIFVSALDDAFDKVRAFTAGGVDYIAKPFQPEEVLARVHVHLDLYRAQQALAQRIQEKEDLLLELDGTNAQLQREIGERRQIGDTLQIYAERLQILHEIGQSILGAHSSETIALAAVNRTWTLIPCQRVMVIEQTEMGETKLLAAESRGADVPSLEVGERHTLFEERALSAGHVLGVADLDRLSSRSPLQQSLYEEGIRAYLVVPLFVRNELIGTFHLEAQEPGLFTADHVTSAIEISAMLTLAIQQNRLYNLAQQEIAVRKQAEERLRQYADELEAQNAELDAFAHTVAHDLKNPLTSLIGFSDLVESRFARMSDERLESSLHAISQSALKMDSIVSELLLLASVRGMDNVQTHPLDMASLIDGAHQRIAHLIDTHQPAIVLPETWPEAWGYGPWVEEVWVNYFSNALKYGGESPRVEFGADPPTFSVSAIRGQTTRKVVRFWVRDNGPGLAPDQQAQLFTPFERLHQARARGHGLGLSIVKRIVEKLGGEVGVESDGIPGHGSTFFFTLPSTPDTGTGHE
jgi:signal transduction histidine kinase/DNA-binding response OmpR family regulator